MRDESKEWWQDGGFKRAPSGTNHKLTRDMIQTVACPYTNKGMYLSKSGPNGCERSEQIWA